MPFPRIFQLHSYVPDYLKEETPEKMDSHLSSDDITGCIFVLFSNVHYFNFSRYQVYLFIRKQ